MTAPLSRRGALGYGAAGGALALGGAAAMVAGHHQQARPETPTAGAQRQTYSPHGLHQAGIDTPTPAATTLVAYDLKPGTTADALARLLRVWSGDIAPLMAGRGALGDPTPEMSHAGVSLSVTVGLGPRVFAIPGLESRRPDGLLDVPPMRHDRLQDRWSGGDLLLQIAADDQTSVAYAERALTRDAAPFASVRWRQTGSWRGTDGAGNPVTGRNLFGQVDGSGNPAGEDLRRAVWPDDVQDWFRGGTSLVLRRIEMHLDEWDRLTRPRQERVIGRRLDTGAPLTGTQETDGLDLTATDGGKLVIPADSHARLAHPDLNSGRRMLRRALNYTHNDGAQQTSGLIFMAFVGSVTRQFVPVQQRLDESDALNEWTTAIGSSVFAIPGGFPPGGWIAQGLFG